jgi:hypothetical protein
MFYSDKHVQDMYEHFLYLYQNRYILASINVSLTWAHISYWRKQMNYWGGKLVERNLLDPYDYFAQKRITRLKCENGVRINLDTVRDKITLHPDYQK